MRNVDLFRRVGPIFTGRLDDHAEPAPVARIADAVRPAPLAFDDKKIVAALFPFAADGPAAHAQRSGIEHTVLAETIVGAAIGDQQLAFLLDDVTGVGGFGGLQWKTCCKDQQEHKRDFHLRRAMASYSVN